MSSHQRHALHIIRRGQQRVAFCGKTHGTPGGKYYPGVEAQHISWFVEHQFPEAVWPRVCKVCRKAYEKLTACLCSGQGCTCRGSCPRRSEILIVRMGDHGAPQVPMCAHCAEKHVIQGVWAQAPAKAQQRPSQGAPEFPSTPL